MHPGVSGLLAQNSSTVSSNKHARHSAWFRSSQHAAVGLLVGTRHPSCLGSVQYSSRYSSSVTPVQHERHGKVNLSQHAVSQLSPMNPFTQSQWRPVESETPPATSVHFPLFWQGLSRQASTSSVGLFVGTSVGFSVGASVGFSVGTRHPIAGLGKAAQYSS